LRLEATADLPVSPADLYAVAADLRNLPAWWIEHLSAEIETAASRPRDAIYRVRYRLPGGLVISARCTMVAARTPRSLTYMWTGGGMRLAVGQSFVARRDGCRTTLVTDLAVVSFLRVGGPLLTRLMRRSLHGELDRALMTLGELAGARSVVRRTAVDRRGADPRGGSRRRSAAPVRL
jgi:uncharacterized protein YndB with AHSA1/START domain